MVDQMLLTSIYLTASTAALAVLVSIPSICFASKPTQKPTFEQYLAETVAKRDAVQRSLEVHHRWQFDGELGVVEGEYAGETGGLPGGIDGSVNVGTFQSNGARTSFMYANQNARINTYGDSFTHGDQVNDGETWQEYLAAHLREPIRNFGVGGYGVYQAYRRMLREEKTSHAANYIVLTICCDDSTRTLFRSWYPITRTLEPFVFGGAKPNLELDLKSGRFVERENPLASEDSLFSLTDSSWMVSQLKDDLALQLQLHGGDWWWVREQRIRTLNREKISKLAALLHFPFDWSPEADTELAPSRYAAHGLPPITRMQAQSLALLNRYAQRATIDILDKARTFASQNEKKLLVVLVLNTDPGRLERSGERDNQEVVNYLQKEKFDYVDIDEALLSDYKNSNTTLTYSEYIKKYMVNGAGHLNPLGNHFFAYTIKNRVVNWLNPKPITYEKREDTPGSAYFFDARPSSVK
jgi:hypothetical protein